MDGWMDDKEGRKERRRKGKGEENKKETAH
jgi:hypothetical protein